MITVDESPDEDVLDQAARAALHAEMDHIRASRKPVFVLPEHGQVKRLIAAAWPVLAAAEAGDGNG